MSDPHIYIVAAEKSGDELGAKLAKALRKRTGKNIKLSGIGGKAMQAQGLTSAIDISPLSILGFLEGVKSYPIIMERVKQAREHIIASGADACVLIDSWGFMMRVAKSLKKHGYQGKIIKYVAPQVWATREGRAKILAAGVDHLLTIHSFDAPYFTKHGLAVTYVGNPVFDEAYDSGDGAALRKQYNVAPDAPVLTVLFGSRLSEIQTLAAPFADAVKRLKQALPELTIVAPLSDTIAEDVLAAAAEHPSLQDVILLGEDRKLDCFAAADVAIACSGTVTTQLASAGVPTIVAYRLNALTYFIVKRIYKPDYVSIVNIAAGAELMPEFLQAECTGARLSGAAFELLNSGKARTKTSKPLRAAVQKMRVGNAVGGQEHSSLRAAKAVLECIG